MKLNVTRFLLLCFVVLCSYYCMYMNDVVTTRNPCEREREANLVISFNREGKLDETAVVLSIILLFCDIVAQFTGNDITLPINAITSIIGAPVVIWLLVNKKRF